MIRRRAVVPPPPSGSALSSVHDVEIEIATNTPPVDGGQEWHATSASVSQAMRKIRVVCRYPFAGPSDGRMWIVESTVALHSLQRLSERTLRSLYRPQP